MRLMSELVHEDHVPLLLLYSLPVKQTTLPKQRAIDYREKMAAVWCYFLLLVIHVTTAELPSPTNVTLNCHNTNNTLKWSYDQQPRPGLKFKVEISSLDRINHSPEWVDSPASQVDLSYLTNPNAEYLLTVTAVIGGNESKSSEKITFSYFQNSQVKQKCSLDLPDVNVTVISEDKVMLRFQHPWLLFQQNLASNSKSNHQKKNKRLNKAELPVFKYYVEIITQEQDKLTSECTEPVCEDTISVNAAKTHCLKIRGDMEKMTVLGTKEYCTQKVDVQKIEKPLIIGACIVALVAISFIIFMVYRKKTLSTTPLPPSMNITSQVKQWTLGNVQEKVVVPQVEPSSPTPLLTGKEESSPVFTPITEYDMRMPIGLLTKDECEGMGDVTEEEQKKDEYMQGTNMDEEEESNSFEGHSSYEKRQVVVELAPGEKAEGYRG